MSQVNRVFHLRTRDNGSKYAPVLAKGGATVIVNGEVGTGQVSVKVAYCNPQDTYAKKRGRTTADAAVEKIIPLRRLPGFLGTTYREALRRSHIRNVDRWELPSYDNRILDFLPKELV